MAERRPHLQLVRECLEGVVSPELSSATLLEALEVFGQVPQELGEVSEFVRGALREALGRRVSPEVVKAVASRLDHVVQPVSSAPPDVDVVEVDVRAASSSRPAWAQAETAVGWSSGTARVVVLADGGGLAERLRLALGGNRVAVAATSDATVGPRLVRDLNASMVLYDMSDPPPTDVDEFVDGFADLPENVVFIVWSSGEPQAERLATHLEACGVRVTTIDRREGVDPLIDMMRARV